MKDYFYHNRKSALGISLSNWLSIPGKALIKKNANQSKCDPLTEDVDAIERNLSYAQAFPGQKRRCHTLMPVNSS